MYAGVRKSHSEAVENAARHIRQHERERRERLNSKANENEERYVRAFRERDRLAGKHTSGVEPPALDPKLPEPVQLPVTPSDGPDYPRLEEALSGLAAAHAEHIRALIEIPDQRRGDFVPPKRALPRPIGRYR